MKKLFTIDPVFLFVPLLWIALTGMVTWADHYLHFKPDNYWGLNMTFNAVFMAMFMFVGGYQSYSSQRLRKLHDTWFKDHARRLKEEEAALARAQTMRDDAMHFHESTRRMLGLPASKPVSTKSKSN